MDPTPPEPGTDLAHLHVDHDRFAREDRLVRDGFWRKLRQAMGRIPFAEDAVAAFYCATDPETPTYVRVVLVGALAYFIMPMDVIPDMIAGLGFIDDASVLLAALSAVGGHLKIRHRVKAQAFFTGAPAEAAEGDSDRP